MREKLVLKLEKINKQKKQTDFYFKDNDNKTYIWNSKTKFDRQIGEEVLVRATMEPIRYGETIIHYIIRNVRLA